MKLYDYQLAPNPRRVRIFLAEKEITVPTVQVDLRAGEQFTPEFRSINPECTVPVLEFDDGRRIAEVVAICLYFELAHPEPALMGVGAQDRAIVADWIAASSGKASGPSATRSATPRPASWAALCPDRTVTSRSRRSPSVAAPAPRGSSSCSRHLAGRQFVASDRYTIADIMGLVTVNFAARINLAIPEGCSHLRRWYETVSARPSAAA